MQWKVYLAAALLLPMAILSVQGEVSGGNGTYGEEMPADGRKDETWTILCYMNGEGNLEDFIASDLFEMEKVGSSDRVNIVVQLDLGTSGSNPSHSLTWSDTRRFRVEYHPESGPGSTRLDDPPLGEVNMDDPESLYDFVYWGLTNYPADHYMIVMEGHSGGPARGLMLDESSSLGGTRMMDVDGMGSALRRAIDLSVGRPVDVISFDVCWMGMAEAASEIKDHALFMIGSFDEIPGEGWPYDVCLDTIVNMTSIPLKDRLSLVVEEYMDHYDPDGSNSYASLAVIDLAAFRDGLLGPLADLGEELFYTIYDDREVYDSILALVDKPRARNDNIWDRYVDLYQFSELLSIDGRVGERVRDAAGRVLVTENSVIVKSKGGANHPSSARLFGIYLPTIRNDQARYSALNLSSFTAWDELAALMVEGLDLEAYRVNWTSPAPAAVTFRLISSTADRIEKVNLETIADGTGNNMTLVGENGVFSGTFPTAGVSELYYRYTVLGRYGNVITFPPDGYALTGFAREDEPPVIWHRVPESIHASVNGGGLSFWIRDGTGIETEDPPGIPRLEYRESGSTNWYSIPLSAREFDPFRGWVRYTAMPTGIEPGTMLEYHMLVSDTYGSSSRFPPEGEAITNMSEGARFYLDAYRSSLGDQNSLMGRFSAMGISLQMGPGPSFGDLSPFKAYILIQPSRPLTESEASTLLAYHSNGLELFIVIDPSDGEQGVNARWLLEGLSVDVTDEGSMEGFFPSNPYSELGDAIPSLTGNSSGSLVTSGDVVYYTTPPYAAVCTGWYGKGRSIVSVSSILSDTSMELLPNRELADLMITYLSQNLPPEIDVVLEPQGTLVPGQELTIDLGQSSDRDGDIVSYSVSFSDGTHSEGPDPYFTHTFHETGSYTLVIGVVDSEGGVSTISRTVKVNRPPSTDHSTSKRTVHAGDVVIFDYKGADPDGDPVVIVWDFGDGFKASGRTVSHTYYQRGTYRYTLTVKDSNGLESNRSAIITVENSDPTAVIDRDSIRVNSVPPNFTGPSRVTILMEEGDRLYLAGDNSHDRDTEDELNLTWDLGDGTTAYGSGIFHVFRSSGLFRVVLTVDDGHGGVDNDTVMVSVMNRDPFAVFTYDELGGGRVVLNASLSTDDPWDMDTLEYIWDLGDGFTERSDGPLLEHRYAFGGSYRVKLTVRDSDGASSTFTGDVDVGGPSFPEVMAISLVVLAVLGSILAAVYIYLRKASAGANLTIREFLSGRGERGFSARRKEEGKRPRLRSFGHLGEVPRKPGGRE